MSMVWKMFLKNGVAWGLGDGEGRVRAVGVALGGFGGADCG